LPEYTPTAEIFEESMDMLNVGEEQDKWPVTEIAVSIFLAVVIHLSVIHAVMKMCYCVDEFHRPTDYFIILYMTDMCWNSRPRKYFHC
jgi:hypothetical protein